MNRLLLAVLLGTALWFVPASGLWSAGAQDGGIQVVVERPLPGTTIAVQSEISGWAVNPYATTGTGIDAVHVYLDGEPGQPRARFLGPASYGLNRADVARSLSEPRFMRSGFSLVTELPAGNHTLYVFAHAADAGPQDGWNRAAVAQFEASSIAPSATMVQPGPAATGDNSAYRTGQASWQGGNTCTRYSGAGQCESSVPFSVATGASCIQFNQRGQCTSYLPADGANIAGTSGASAPPAPTRAPGASGTAPLAVPTAGLARPPVAAVRAAPPAPSGDDAAAEDDASATSDAAPARAPAALPAARAPGISSAAPAAAPPAAAVAVAPPLASSGDPAPARAVSVAPPPAVAATPRPEVPATIIQRVSGSPLDPQGDASGPVSRGPTPTAIAIGSSTGSALDIGAPSGDALPAYVAPTAAPVDPRAVATQQAIQAAGGSSPSTGGLRSGCAMYLGCGGATPVPADPSHGTVLGGGGTVLSTGATGAPSAGGGTALAGGAPSGGTLLGGTALAGGGTVLSGGGTVLGGGATTGAPSGASSGVPGAGTIAAVPPAVNPGVSALVPTATATPCLAFGGCASAPR